ncbi:Ubiquitin carboxyl-terminal hydrolase 10, partial [Halocaridina rubra]
MSSSSQGFEFLDLSGVGDEDRQHLLSLFTSDNPAVVLLSSDVSVGASERYEDVGEETFHHVPLPSTPQEDLPREASPQEDEPLAIEDTSIQEDYIPPVSFLSEAAPEADTHTSLTTQTTALTLEDNTEVGVAYPAADTSFTTEQQQPPILEEAQVLCTANQGSGGMGDAGSPSSICNVPVLPQQNQIGDDTIAPQSASHPIVHKPPVSQQPQIVVPQVTKMKTESNPIVSLNIGQTSITDITFMSDEMQPNVDPEDAVDFTSLHKPAVVSPNMPSNATYRTVPPLTAEGMATVADNAGSPPAHTDLNSAVVLESVTTPLPSHEVGDASPLVEVPPKNVYIPGIVAANPHSNPQPGGAWAQKKSWSQLFKPCEDGGGAKQVAYVAPFNQDSEKPCCENTSRDVPILKAEPLMSEADFDKAKIGAMLRGYIQDHHQVSLQPRGLINKGYWCYVNAPLQALLACPPFYNLMKNVPNIAGLKKGKSTTPVIDSIVEYVHEFSEMAPTLKPSKKEKSNQGARMEPDINPGSPFEPLYVYKMLSNMGGDMFTEGRQQDAEEMLSVVLNGLHDEMVESLKLAGGDSTPTPDNSVNGSVNGETVTSDHEEMSGDDEDEWRVMGPRKKSCVTRTAHITPSPISAIFWGQLRSVLHQAGGETTANLQPFTTLPLDIQSPKVESVREALEQLVSREDIPDYTCSKTNQEVTVCKQVLLETLPTVLILQLKRFIYDKDGGLQKVTKKVNFPIDLEITK